ncbi:hypothetical protein HPB50_020657 [Hyalomma asiaticum]|uniref:Uncharacterized protein n=1 Tax=Hyalomma asiaticum TaxID=266040 RepID=A0ACB7SN88_HYAAI|nr:hypothetical protein HPB50_020657 [Hyalomma asiaticum]
MDQPSPAEFVRAPCVPDNQREMLLSFLEQYPSLARRSFSATRYCTAADRRRLWNEITEALNAEGPMQKTCVQWQLWWRKQVLAARRDYRAVDEAQSGFLCCSSKEIRGIRRALERMAAASEQQVRLQREILQQFCAIRAQTAAIAGALERLQGGQE